MGEVSWDPKRRRSWDLSDLRYILIELDANTVKHCWYCLKGAVAETTEIVNPYAVLQYVSAITLSSGTEVLNVLRELSFSFIYFKVRQYLPQYEVEYCHNTAEFCCCAAVPEKIYIHVVLIMYGRRAQVTDHFMSNIHPWKMVQGEKSPEVTSHVFKPIQRKDEKYLFMQNTQKVVQRIREIQWTQDLGLPVFSTRFYCCSSGLCTGAVLFALRRFTGGNKQVLPPTTKKGERELHCDGILNF